jgi:hypothetical protein
MGNRRSWRTPRKWQEARLPDAGQSARRTDPDDHAGGSFTRVRETAIMMPIPSTM